MASLTEERKRLHSLIDLLGPDQVHEVRGLVSTLLDPVTTAIANAPVDDEPLTEDDRLALAEADEWLKHNEPIPHDIVLAELGITQDEIDNYRDHS